jgi:predicted HNH restriction endonuclease
MPRIAEAIHVIEKKTAGARLRRVKGSRTDWETAYWIIGETTAQSLIGGMIYVHRGQNVASHAGGKIVKIYHEPSSDLKRRVVRFRLIASAKGVVAERDGWGNERKIDWRFVKSEMMRVASDDDESAFPEGKKKYALHRSRERDCALTRRAKRKRFEETGKLECEVCKFDFSLVYGQHGEGFIEAHHRVLVSQLDGKVRTKLNDLALVCSNCHRMLHRGKSLPTVEGLCALREGEV